MTTILREPGDSIRFIPALALLSGLALFMALAPTAAAQQPPDFADVIYATAADKELALDIYLPDNVDSPPLVVQVHGGAWRALTKHSGVPLHLLQDGFAVASIEFHMSTEAQFPVMVHDIKGAIRWLRTHADDYGYNAERIAITGQSSGAHLATLVGVTNGHRELEGDVGGNNAESSDVQAIIAYYGAFDLTTILDQSTPFGLALREPALRALLGATPEENPDIARLASPVYHVDQNDPPLLLFHGDRDPQMPVNQSLQLEGAYLDLGLDVKFDAVHGAAHGGPEFYDETHLPPVIEFLDRTIKN
ncbi:MAG: alpha/beta hydrolase [Pseudohongiellaceae bacterium]